MNDRLFAIIGGLVALLAVYTVLVPKPAPAPPVSRPTSQDPGDNGYRGLAQWLAANGISTESLRHRYDALYEQSVANAASGNIVIVTLPQSRRPRFDEIEQLIGWVARGNTLLVLAPLHDSPSPWLYLSGGEFLREDLESITAAEITDGNEPGEKRELDYSVKTLTASPLFPHPLLDGVSRLYAETDSAPYQRQIRVLPDAPLFALAADDGSGRAALWEQRIGEGRLVLAGYSNLLMNRAIGHEDNRQFVVNLIGSHLRPGGRFIFDDMHQGLSELYDPDAFFSDPRLHNSIYFIIGFWLLYVIGTTNRLGKPRRRRQKIGEDEFVRACGRFIARRADPHDAANRMFAIFFNQVRRNRNLPANGEPIWGLLYRSPLIPDSVLTGLRTKYDSLQRGDKPDLRRLHNQLNQVRKAFL